MQNFDIVPTGIKSLTPKEWEALKQHFIQRAHAERAQMIREIGRQVLKWLRAHVPTRKPLRDQMPRSASGNANWETAPSMLFHSLRS